MGDAKSVSAALKAEVQAIATIASALAEANQQLALIRTRIDAQVAALEALPTPRPFLKPINQPAAKVSGVIPPPGFVFDSYSPNLSSLELQVETPGGGRWIQTSASPEIYMTGLSPDGSPWPWTSTAVPNGEVVLTATATLKAGGKIASSFRFSVENTSSPTPPTPAPTPKKRKPVTRVIRDLNSSLSVSALIAAKPNALLIGTNAAERFGAAGLRELESAGIDIYGYLDGSTQEPYSYPGVPIPPATGHLGGGAALIDISVQSGKDYFLRRLDWWANLFVRAGLNKPNIYSDDPHPYDVMNTSNGKTAAIKYTQFTAFRFAAMKERGVRTLENLCYLAIAFDRAATATWNPSGWWTFGPPLANSHEGSMGLIKLHAAEGHAVSLESVHFDHGTGYLSDGVNYDSSSGRFSVAYEGSQFWHYAQWGEVLVAILGSDNVNALDYVPGRSRADQRAAALDSAARGWGYAFDTWGNGLPAYLD